jgi:hypothetical protein
MAMNPRCDVITMVWSLCSAICASSSSPCLTSEISCVLLAVHLKHTLEIRTKEVTSNRRYNARGYLLLGKLI